MHLHTCGAYAPGEISLNVLDPTIVIDGKAVWDDGRLHPERVVSGDKILADYPELVPLFESPAQACGQGKNGRLTSKLD